MTTLPTPYYSADAVTVYHADSLEVIDGIQPATVDCVVTDPPYCSGATEAARRGKREAPTPESVKARPTIQLDDMGLLGYEWVTRRWFLAARKFVKPGGHLVCFTDWRMTPWVQMMLETAGWRLTNLVVWDKRYPGLGTGFRAQHEFVVIASNGQPEWHSYDFGNVIASTRLTSTEHPHEKPIDLLSKIIKTCSPVGGVILDPFMGSGTTLRAAKDLGRRAIGIELEERYCQVAVRRLQQSVMQFDEPETHAHANLERGVA